jgi:hypothetical protein
MPASNGPLAYFSASAGQGSLSQQQDATARAVIVGTRVAPEFWNQQRLHHFLNLPGASATDTSKHGFAAPRLGSTAKLQLLAENEKQDHFRPDTVAVEPSTVKTANRALNVQRGGSRFDAEKLVDVEVEIPGKLDRRVPKQLSAQWKASMRLEPEIESLCTWEREPMFTAGDFGLSSSTLDFGTLFNHTGTTHAGAETGEESGWERDRNLIAWEFPPSYVL